MKGSPKRGFMDWYFETNLLLRIALGLILGALVGILAGESILWVAPLGDLFIRLLQMIVMPVVFTTLVVGAASINPASLGRVGIKIVLFYLLTSAFAATLGLLAGNLFRPGAGLELAPVSKAAGRELARPSLIETLLAIVPANPFAAIAGGQVLPTIFFAIVFGIGLSYLRVSQEERLRQAGDTLYRMMEAAAEVMYRIVRWVLQYAPIGVFALIAVVFATQGAAAAGPLASVVLAVYLALVVHVGVVYGGLLALNRLSLLTFLRGAREAMLTAFVTRSSSGTLPVSMQCSGQQHGVDRTIFSFTLPLGATINMDGTAIYQGVCALFIGFAVGLPLTFTQQFTLVITAVLASIGTAGVPGAGALMLLMVLDSVGLPIVAGSPAAAAYAMILGIDALLDMGRTWVNVTGDLTGTLLVAKSERQVELAKW